MRRPRRRGPRSNLQTTSTRLLLALLSTLLFLGCWCDTLLAVDAYRIGDVVNTDIFLDSIQSDALRHQMPLFAVNSQTDIRVDEQQQRTTPSSFRLQFEDGLWTLPTAYLQQKNEQNLEKIQVQFVYSNSGVGALHAVHSQAIYGTTGFSSSTSPQSFAVEYEWIAEPAVHLTSGFTVMFLAVLLSSLYFLLASCSSTGGDGVSRRSSSGPTAHLASPPEFGAQVPKWD